MILVSVSSVKPLLFEGYSKVLNFSTVSAKCLLNILAISSLFTNKVSFSTNNTKKELSKFSCTIHCVKSIRIRSYSGPHFPTFGLNTERYSVSLRIQSECGKMRTRITPHTDTFHAVVLLDSFTLFQILYPG